MDWTMNIDFWAKHGATSGKGGNIVFPGGGYGASKAIYKALIDQLN
jgi:hypothetical protein